MLHGQIIRLPLNSHSHRFTLTLLMELSGQALRRCRQRNFSALIQPGRRMNLFQRLEKCMVLRATGLPLAEIRFVLAIDEPFQAKAQPDGHQTRLGRQIDEAQRSRSRLESLVAWLTEQEGKMET